MKPLRPSDFEVLSCQATLFTPDGGMDSSRLVRDLLPQWVDLFNGDPVMLPIPQDVPSDVPRIILSSRDETWRCEIAKERINLFRRKPRALAQFPDIADFYTAAEALLQQYAQIAAVRIGRIAGVVRRVAKQESPGLYISRHFCKECWHSSPLNRPEGFELHAHKKYILSEKFRVNSWARNKSGKMQIEDKEVSIVIFEQDINTLSEEEAAQSFGMDDIATFFRIVSTEFDSILALYYPPEAPDAKTSEL